VLKLFVQQHYDLITMDSIHHILFVAICDRLFDQFMLILILVDSEFEDSVPMLNFDKQPLVPDSVEFSCSGLYCYDSLNVINFRKDPFMIYQKYLCFISLIVQQIILRKYNLYIIGCIAGYTRDSM
jgi:hypothetical protein